MKLAAFLKEKISYIFAHAFVLLLTVLILRTIGTNTTSAALVALIAILYIIGACVPLLLEYHKKSEFYNTLLGSYHMLDRKNLLAEIIPVPDFKEGRILYDVIKGSNKACLDEINGYKRSQEEYREYIELWVHEIKTPIASTKLILENHKEDIPADASLLEEVNKIEGYIEQALYYSRSNSVEKDYLIREIRLKEPVIKAIQKNSAQFIEKKVSVETENLDGTIFCDAKWLEYILSQILSNAIKYAKPEDARIKISAVHGANGVSLTIRDNGVGILPDELPRIFDKGFTGSNGRTFEKSTGMGLYICQKLCQKLGLSLSAESKWGEGTDIYIGLPVSSMTRMDG